MAQHDYVIDNSTGANVRADINNALLAISSNNSGSSAPSTTYALQSFANTTDSMLQLRNAANNAFVNLRKFDGSCPLPDGTNSAPSLFFDDDTNTGIYSSAADTFNVATGGTERMELGTVTIFNEDGADVDFRIEGDTEANLFYVDAGNNRVAVGTSTPSATFDVVGDIEATIANNAGYQEGLNITNGTNADFNVNIKTNSTSIGPSTNTPFCFHVSGHASERARIDTSGRLLVGCTTSRGTAGGDARVQIENTSTELLSLVRTSNDAGASVIAIGKTRNGAIVQDDDVLGQINFVGDDGNDLDRSGAEIRAAVDGTPAADDMPARLEFRTTSDGSAVSTTRMSILSDGKCGIGESLTPTTLLHIQRTSTTGYSTSNTTNDTTFLMINSGAAGHATMQFQVLSAGGTPSTGQATISAFSSSASSKSTTLSFGTRQNSDAANNERMRITHEGRVGIATSAPKTDSFLTVAGRTTMTVADNSAYQVALNATNDVNADFFIAIKSSSTSIGPSTGTPLCFHTSGTSNEHMRIDSSGNVLVGTISTTVDSSNFGIALFADHGIGVFKNVNNTATVGRIGGNQGRFRVMGDGDAENSNNSYGGFSDINLKQDIVDAGSQWDDIKGIKVRKYRFKDNPTGSLQLGVIGQEIETVSAGLVKTDDEGIKSVKYSVLYMKAVKCLQEAIAKIEVLETKVAALEAA